MRATEEPRTENRNSRTPSSQERPDLAGFPCVLGFVSWLFLPITTMNEPEYHLCSAN